MKITKKEITVRAFAEAEVQAVTVNDMIQAERVTGKGEGIAFIAAVIANATTFDGKKQPMEVVAEISAADFFDLLEATGLGALKASLPESSASAGKDASA
ncbi:MAG: hypothetical protein AB7F61_14340 [Desulfobulbus sp.]